MPSAYGATHVTTKPIALSDETLIAIGRLVRAFAEVEELVTLFISALAKLNQSQAVIVLGKAALVRRLEMAEHLAKISGGEHLDRYNACFNTVEFRDAHTCRNVVAHGILLGEDSEGVLAFLTDKTDAPLGNSTIQLVASYQPKTINDWSLWTANNVEPMANHLGLQSWLKRYQPQALRPHRKGRLPRGAGGKSTPPPQSSEG